MSKCTDWEKAKNEKGYGKLFYNGKFWYAHRYVWMLKNGTIPDGMLVCHKCDNPSCINIDHLFLGTYKDNTQDCIKKGRHRMDGIVYGYGEKHKNSKLNNVLVDFIRLLCSEGYGTVEVSKMFGIPHTTISGIKHRISWRHI